MKSLESRVKNQRELFPCGKRTKPLPRSLHNSIGFQNCYGPVSPLYLLLSHSLTGVPRAVNLSNSISWRGCFVCLVWSLSKEMHLRSLIYTQTRFKWWDSGLWANAVMEWDLEGPWEEVSMFCMWGDVNWWGEGEGRGKAMGASLKDSPLLGVTLGNTWEFTPPPGCDHNASDWHWDM